MGYSGSEWVGVGWSRLEWVKLFWYNVDDCVDVFKAAWFGHTILSGRLLSFLCEPLPICWLLLHTTPRGATPFNSRLFVYHNSHAVCFIEDVMRSCIAYTCSVGDECMNNTTLMKRLARADGILLRPGVCRI